MHIRTVSSFYFRNQELWGGAQDQWFFVLFCFFILQVILMLLEFEM